MAVFERALLFGLAPEDFVIAVGVEGRVNIDEVNAGVGQFLELLKIVAAVNDTRVHEGRGTAPHPDILYIGWGEGLRRTGKGFFRQDMSLAGPVCGIFRGFLCASNPRRFLFATKQAFYTQVVIQQRPMDAGTRAA